SRTACCWASRLGAAAGRGRSSTYGTVMVTISADRTDRAARMGRRSQAVVYLQSITVRRLLAGGLGENPSRLAHIDSPATHRHTFIAPVMLGFHHQMGCQTTVDAHNTPPWHSAAI